MMFLLLYCCPQHLHSLPTRRSSDLFSGNGSADMHESLKERSSLAAIGGRDVFEKCVKFTAADNARRMGVYPDRKSTRLNSSHLVISYAVFCLKKKKFHIY